MAFWSFIKMVKNYEADRIDCFSITCEFKCKCLFPADQAGCHA